MRIFRKTDFLIRDTYEYAFSAIPETRKKPTASLLAVLAGAAFSTSGMALGIRVGLSMPFFKALGVCLFGNLLLCVVALFWGILGCQTGYASVNLIKRMLGNRTAIVYAILVILITSVWVGMNGNLIAKLLIASVPGWTFPVAVTTLGAVMVCVLCAANGWKSIELISWLAVPVLVVLTVYNLILTGDAKGGFAFLRGYQPEHQMTVAAAITSIMGNYALSATTMPDISRFAKNRKSVFFSVGLYGLVLTLSDVCGILIAQATSANNLSYGIYLLGMMLPGCLWIVLCTYTTQNVNMYSGGLAIQKLVHRTVMEGNISHRSAMLFLGGFSVIVGVMDGSKYLPEVSKVILQIMLPLTGIAVVDLFAAGISRDTKDESGERTVREPGQAVSRQTEWRPLLIWLLGITVSVIAWMITRRELWILSVITAAGAAKVWAKRI